MEISTSIPALVIHGVIALLFGIVGYLFCLDAPSIRPVKEWVEGVLKTLISKDLFVHRYIFGVLFFLVAIGAFVNIVLIVAKAYNFWL